jgi:hypothetical protein
LIAGVN